MAILKEIVESKRREVEQRAARRSIAELDATPLAAPRRDFCAAIRRPAHAPIRAIAEIKRRSPSRGDIRAGLDPARIAAEYQQAGAAALSVLTDGPYFGGTDADLAAARAAATLPALRKDFTLDEYQIHEARAIGADAVLLIVRLLTPTQLLAWIGRAQSLGLSALVETHNESEVRVAIDCGATIIGVNSRDLDTLEINLDRAIALRGMIPAGCVAVAESGIRTRADVLRIEAAGFDAILVGETLLAAASPGDKLAELVAGPAS